ncbi:MAG: hypothetical protein GC182_10750 [Rhodopseudomonas sp.]|nr:hypothetical protein [Rhodopseudomonas sp.]
MTQSPHEPDNNVVQMPAKPRAGRQPMTSFVAAPADDVFAVGSADDPRVQEALRLVRAFLAIEDAPARDALIALAERLVSKAYRLDVRNL